MDFKKKIIFLTYIPSPYRVDFFNELSKVCDLTVVFYYPSMDNEPWQNSDKKLYFKNLYLYQKSSFMSGTITLFKFLFEHKNDVIIIGGYAKGAEIAAIFFLKLFNIKFVINSDGGFVTQGFLKKILKTILIKSASNWLSSGVNTTKTLVYYGAEKANIFEYNFSSLSKKEIVNDNLSLSDVKLLRQELGLAKDSIYLIFVGQLIYRKGVDILLKSLETVNPNVNLNVLIIGSGDQKENLLEIVNKSNSPHKVQFLGKLSKNSVLNYLKVSDCFVFPSRYDIWGLVLNEAVANGLPIISSSAVGSAYSLIKQGENGFILDVNDPLCLSNAINDLISKDLNIMKKNSIAKAKDFTIERMVADHLVLFNKLNATSK